MNQRLKIVLLGLVIWVIAFIAGGVAFSIFDVETGGIEIWGWTSGIKEFSISIGLALALILVFKNNIHDYKRTALEAGIIWYAILLLMDLIVLIGLLGLKIELWYPLIVTYSTVLIIPIAVGYLLARPK